MKEAIYPGSFDPLTNGHLDIVKRALQTFDIVTIAIADNIQKKHVFDLNERVALVKECTRDLPNLRVDTFNGLLMDYARLRGVKTVLRGLRSVSDFEYEFQLAYMNRTLAPDVETVFLMAGGENFYVSSKLVREAAQFGGNLSEIVPEPVNAALKKKFPR